jgi:hypothetical protein
MRTKDLFKRDSSASDALGLRMTPVMEKIPRFSGSKNRIFGKDDR